MFPIDEFEWSDTGEKISDYYARYTQNATSLQRFLCSKKFILAVIAICVLLTEIGVYFLLVDKDKFVLIFCLFAGVMIGALIGGAVFLHAIASPITRQVCGVRDTRLLK